MSVIKITNPCEGKYFAVIGNLTFGEGGYFWDHGDVSKWSVFQTKEEAIKAVLKVGWDYSTKNVTTLRCPFCDAEIVGENSNRCRHCNGRMRINRHVTYSVEALLWEEERNDEEAVY